MNNPKWKHHLTLEVKQKMTASHLSEADLDGSRTGIITICR